MAHYLPRKKYLSKLLHDSPDDKTTLSSSSSSAAAAAAAAVLDSNISSSSCDKLSANESTESLLMAIANSTSLGISSNFGSAVFAAVDDDNGNCPTAAMDFPATSASESANCHDGPGTQREWRGSNDEDDGRTAHDESAESSPVYFDDGSMDDVDDDGGLKMEEDNDVALSSSQQQQQQQLLARAEVIPLTSSSDRLTLPSAGSADQLTSGGEAGSLMLPGGEGGSLTLPGSVSMSNLIDDDVLNTLMPSAESFANLLSSLETAKDNNANPNNKPNINPNHSRAPSQTTHEQTASNKTTHINPRLVSSNNADTSLRPQECQPSSSSSLTAEAAAASAAAACYTVMTRPPTSSYQHHDAVYVKQEQIDNSYEQLQLQQQQLEQLVKCDWTATEPPQSSLVTTSGRNRGRGRASEPKYDCQICGDVAAGYHCGAYVCEACKVLT